MPIASVAGPCKSAALHVDSWPAGGSAGTAKVFVLCSSEAACSLKHSMTLVFRRLSAMMRAEVLFCPPGLPSGNLFRLCGRRSCLSALGVASCTVGCTLVFRGGFGLWPLRDLVRAALVRLAPLREDGILSGRAAAVLAHIRELCCAHWLRCAERALRQNKTFAPVDADISGHINLSLSVNGGAAGSAAVHNSMPNGDRLCRGVVEVYVGEHLLVNRRRIAPVVGEAFQRCIAGRRMTTCPRYRFARSDYAFHECRLMDACHGSCRRLGRGCAETWVR